MGPGWSRLDPYRGVNANMHAVEARLAAYDATGERAHLDRALHVTARVADDWARSHDWRVPEHFDPDWRPLPAYHRSSRTTRSSPTVPPSGTASSGPGSR